MNHYYVNTFDSAADGMERLRNQSESILLAYPSEDATPESILAAYLGDLDSVAREDGFSFDLARQAIQSWYAEDGESILATELAEISAEQWKEAEEDSEAWPVYRIYLHVPAYRFEFCKLSGTGILIRTSDAAETLRYTGSDAAELAEASEEILEETGRFAIFEESKT